MIDLLPLRNLDAIETLLADHADAGRELHWLGGGARALALAGLDRDEGIAAAFEPAQRLAKSARCDPANIAGLSLHFAPPFDIEPLRASGMAADVRAVHVDAARYAMSHLEVWTPVHDAHGSPVRPSGFVAALCTASNSFFLDMLILGWAVGPGGTWGTIDGWSLARELAAAESIYIHELDRGLTDIGLQLIWTGGGWARVKPMRWRRFAIRTIAAYTRRLDSM
ncbi:hypothetical protein ACIPPQ_18945 [Sphingopyxis sp. LARHCG72]